MKRNKTILIIGAAILAVFSLAALVPELLAPYGLKEMFTPWLPPNWVHPLGTNDLGYDILTELIYAARPTLFVGIAAAGISLVLGTLIGLSAGYLKGIGGELAGGLIQIFMMLPMLPMSIVISAYLGSELRNIILIIALLGWSATARSVRARTMQLRSAGFVEALELLGIGKTRIMLRHVMPNLTELICSRYIMSVSRCIMLEATLSFMGMGDITKVSWGRMINLAYSRGAFTRGAFNWLLTPGICIALVVISFYCINAYFEGKSREVSGSESYMD